MPRKDKLSKEERAKKEQYERDGKLDGFTPGKALIEMSEFFTSKQIKQDQGVRLQCAKAFFCYIEDKFRAFTQGWNFNRHMVYFQKLYWIEFGVNLKDEKYGELRIMLDNERRNNNQKRYLKKKDIEKKKLNRRELKQAEKPAFIEVPAGKKVKRVKYYEDLIDLKELDQNLGLGTEFDQKDEQNPIIKAIETIEEKYEADQKRDKFHPVNSLFANTPRGDRY